MDNFLVGIKFDATEKKLESQLKKLLSGIQETAKTLKIKVDIGGLEDLGRLKQVSEQLNQQQKQTNETTRKQQKEVSNLMRLLREKNTLEVKLLRAGREEESVIRSRITEINSQVSAYDNLNRTEQQNLAIVRQQERATSNLAQQQARQTDQVLSGTEQIKKFSTKLVTAAGKFGLWTGIAGVIFGIQRAIKDTFNTVAQMDTALTSLSITTGKSAEDFKGLRAEVEKMSIQLGQLATDIIYAANEFQRAGFNIQDSITLAKNALIGANVGMSEVSETTRFLVSTLQAFNMSANDSQRVIDVMFNVSKNAAVSFNQLGEGLSSTSAFMAEANLTFEEGTAILTGANQSIQNMEKSSTALRTMLANLFSTVEEDGEVVPKFEEDLLNIGVALRKSDGEFRDSIDIIRDLQTSFGNMTDQTEKQRIALELAGKRNVAVFFSMVNNGKIMEEALVNAMNSTGEAAEANEIYVESIEGKIAQLKATIDKLQTTVLSSDMFKGLIDGLKNGVQYIQDMIENTNILIGNILSLSAAFTTTKLTMAAWGAEATTIGLLAPEIAVIGLAIVGLTAAFTAHQRAVLEAKRATEEFEEAQATLNNTISTGSKQELEDLVKKLELLKMKYDEINETPLDVQDKGYFGALAEKEKQLEALNAEMNESGISVENYSQKMGELNKQYEFLTRIETERKSLNTVKDKQDEISMVQQLAEQYNNLSKEAKNNNSESQKMSIIAERLQDIIPGVTSVTDEYGNVQLTNIGIIKDWIKSEEDSVTALSDNSAKRLRIEKEEAITAINLMKEQMLVKAQLYGISQMGVTGIGKAIAGEITKEQTNSYVQMTTAQQRAQQDLAKDPSYELLQSNLKMIDDALNEVTNTSIKGVAKVSRVNDSVEKSAKKAGKSTKETAEFISELSNRYDELNSKIAETNEALDLNSKLTSVASESEKISLIEQRIGLLAQMKTQLSEINDERRKEREELTKNLESMGIYSEIVNDRTVIKNLEDINKIKGKDVETTNELRKEAENIVKQIQSMDTEINKTGQDWWSYNIEIQKQLKEINDTLIETKIEKHKDLIEDINEDYDERIEKVKKEIEHEKELIDSIEKEYSARIKAIKEEEDRRENVNKEVERQKELQEKQNQLQKERNRLLEIQKQKTVKLFTGGQFRLVADPRRLAEQREAVFGAEEAVRQTIEKQKEERHKELIDERIKDLERLKEKEIEDHKEKIARREESIVLLEEDKEREIEYHNEKIERLEKEKENFVAQHELLKMQLEEKIGMRKTDLEDMNDYAKKMIDKYNEIARAKSKSEGTTSTTSKSSSGGGGGKKESIAERKARISSDKVKGYATGGVVSSNSIVEVSENEPEVITNQAQIARAENYFKLLSGQMSLDSYLPKIGVPNVSSITNSTSTIDKGTTYQFYGTQITTNDATKFYNDMRRRATRK